MGEERGLKPTLETYHIMLKRVLYDPNFETNDSYKAIADMKANGIRPTLETYTEKMEADGIRPTVESYLGLIASYAETGDLKEATPLIHLFSKRQTEDYLDKHDPKRIAKE